MTRPTFDEYFLTIATAVARRADCTRAQHGAVITQNRRIVSTGYNGPPAGSPLSCTKGDCPRGQLDPSELAHLAGGYDNCIATHAEANALIYANRADVVNATLYVTGEPCVGCRKLCLAAGITRIVWPDAEILNMIPIRADTI